MSGGHFNYAYEKVSDFADELKNALAEPKEWCNWSEETNSKLFIIQHQAERLARLMKEVEWLYSGDTSEETFVDSFNKGC